MQFNFQTREQYLQQAAEWKAEYEKHSDYIRSLKASMRQPQANWPYGVQYHLVSAKQVATTMIKQRLASKEEAGRQWTAARRTEKATA